MTSVQLQTRASSREVEPGSARLLSSTRMPPPPSNRIKNVSNQRNESDREQQQDKDAKRSDMNE